MTTEQDVVTAAITHREAARIGQGPSHQQELFAVVDAYVAVAELGAKRPRIAEIMQAAAKKRWDDESRLRRALETLVLGKRAAGRYRIGEIVTVAADHGFTEQPDAETPRGSYAVEVIERTDKHTEKSMWTTVNEGESDSMQWYSVDQALIHLIALRKGERDDRGEIVAFASRVIGFDDYK